MKERPTYLRLIKTKEKEEKVKKETRIQDHESIYKPATIQEWISWRGIVLKELVITVSIAIFFVMAGLLLAYETLAP